MTDAIRALLAAPRAPDPPARTTVEGLLILALSALGLLEGLFSDGVVGWRPVAVGFSVLFPLALLWRRTHPLLALATPALAVIGAWTAAAVLPEQWDLTATQVVALCVLMHALTRWGAGREVAAGAALVVGMVVLLVVVKGEAGWRTPDPSDDVPVALTFTVWSLPAVLGYVARLRDATHRGRVREVRQGERARLARELHDSVAHHVSAIAVQAQAARVVAASRPDAVLGVLKAVEDEASRALAEMRVIVGALRDGEGAETVPQLRLADVKRLASPAAAGPVVEVELTGELDAIAPSVEAGLYRLAQESVTNAIRHARRARRIAVRVEGGRDHVRLTVVDDGEALPTTPRTSGFGIVGMSERAALLGGRFEAGPGPGEGWRVEVELPKAGPATR